MLDRSIRAGLRLNSSQLAVPLDHSTRVKSVEGSRSVLIGSFYCISLKYQSWCCAQALAVDWFKLNSRHSKAAHQIKAHSPDENLHFYSSAAQRFERSENALDVVEVRKDSTLVDFYFLYLCNISL